MIGARITVIVALVASTAEAARPVLAGEATHGGDDILVHYATTGVDAVSPVDANTDGVPDFVAEVATTAELALDQFVALGFRRPVTDDALGGDGRIDIYLRNLSAADGNASTDVCTGTRCSGHIIAENDYAGFTYPSVTEGIRSVVPHELFHLVQYAYAMDQPATWTEGTAVWAVEQLYGTGNSDFERFLPSFLTRSYRPFERAVGGFGDSYPYGAALWPYFLDHAYGPETIVAAWTACETVPFLEATDDALAASDTTIDAAFTEFTRWNAFTGPRLTTTGGYPDPRGWVEAPREPAVTGAATIYVEGLSARYVTITLAERSRLAVAPTGGIRIAAWLVAEGSGLDGGIELAADGAAHTATVDAGTYTLVVTGLSRGTITTAVDLAIGAPLPEPEDRESGCASSPATGLHGMLAVLAAFPWRRRRRR